MVSCQGPRYVDFFPCHDNGVPKPKVVLLPVKVPDTCPASLGNAIQQDLRLCMMDHGDLYLFNQESVNQWAEKHTDTETEGKDLSWTKSLKGADFIAVVEAVDYRPYTYSCGCDMPYVIIKLRLKVIDTRSECPRVVLFELFETCQQVIKPRKGKASEETSLGSHRLLCNKVADRIERVIRSLP